MAVVHVISEILNGGIYVLGYVDSWQEKKIKAFDATVLSPLTPTPESAKTPTTDS